MRLALTLAAAALALPLPLLAQAADPAPDAPAAEPVKKAKKAKAENPDRLICKQEKKTGSRMGVTSTCLTARQWQELAERTRDQMDDRSRSTNEY